MILLVVLFQSCKPTVQNKSPISEIPLLKSKSTGYFHAIGTEPFWRLEIAEEGIRFMGIEETDKFDTPHTEPIRAMDANVTLYKLLTESGEMNITISQVNCSDNMTDKLYDYNVNIELKRGAQAKSTNYSGCGDYIADYRLYDIWLLEELESKIVVNENFSGEIPILEINASEKKFMGNGGCNRISGTLFQERELLRFTNMISTKMGCDSENLESIYLKVLQSCTGYKIQNNRLYLSNPDGIKLIFKKID